MYSRISHFFIDNLYDDLEATLKRATAVTGSEMKKAVANAEGKQ